jgi:uncharacterized protein (TIGR03083 family)
MDRDTWLETLRREGTALRATLAPEVLDHQVPSCPQWTLGQLAGHLGQMYRFHADHLPRGSTDKPEFDERSQAPDGAAVIEWYEESLAIIRTTLADLDPHLPAWNWSVAADTVLFWCRRMAHETLIHRWDAQCAVGLPEPLDAALAADGIHEVLETWVQSRLRLRPGDAEGVVRLLALDRDQTWLVRIRPVGLTILDGDTLLDPGPAARTTVKGNASDLDLALWGRIPFTTLDTTGNTALLALLRADYET